MMPSDKQKIQEYEELIKKYGPKKAAEIMRKDGAVYEEDFTTEHRKNPIFSNENTEQLAKPTERILRRLAMKHIDIIPLRLKQYGTPSRDVLTILVGSEVKLTGTSHVMGEIFSPEDPLFSSTSVEGINLNSTDPILSIV